MSCARGLFAGRSQLFADAGKLWIDLRLDPLLEQQQLLIEELSSSRTACSREFGLAAMLMRFTRSGR